MKVASNSRAGPYWADELTATSESECIGASSLVSGSFVLPTLMSMEVSCGKMWLMAPKTSLPLSGMLKVNFFSSRNFPFRGWMVWRKSEVGKCDKEGGLGSEIEFFEVKWEFVDVS